MWRQVEAGIGAARAGAAGAVAPAAPSRPRFAQLPSVADAITPLDDAIGLLQMAAEVEHALLVQYLYANASVVRSTGGMSVSGTIRTIAVEEMGHLIAVQNLLLAIGGPGAHHFGRDVGNPDFVPIPFVLEPLDRASAAKYVVVERPKHIADAAVLARVEALEDDVRAATGLDPNRVGALYAAIYWLLQPSDDPFGPEPFTVEDGFRRGWHVRETDFQRADEITTFATTIDEWRNFPGLIATVATDALTACETVHAIMAQGEGVSASDDSHFEEFLAVLDAIEAGRVTVAPLPCSPFVQGQPRPADPRAVQLTHPYTTAWGELLNLVYTHVVGCIANGLARPFGDQTRAELIDIALTAMRPVLTLLTRQIVKLPIADSPGAPAAGPTFGLLREDWPVDPAAFEVVHRHLLATEDSAIAAIQARPEHAGDAQGRVAVDAVKKLQDRIRLLLH
ncbi:Ferritin-like protein [Luteitalea pratensis]|uniref:Ferritin-like protein n=2 Tax=Luteitalea pratensis TaxID=1855912 RepID=A0A143PES1_LUTPR|nr:Ferritin-like protein [Luteitalea pratensis]